MSVLARSGRFPGIATGPRRTVDHDSYMVHINRPRVVTPLGANVSNGSTARRAGAFRRALPWIVAALVLSTLGLPLASAISALPSAPSVGYARPLASTVNLTVNLTDQPGFSPQFLTVPGGASVSIHLDNVGNYSHTFTVSKTAGVALPSSLSPAELYAFFRTNGSLANVSLAPGTQGWANITFNASVTAPASFEFVSVVPYQFQAGMWGFLNLTSTGPGLQLSENTTNDLRFVPNILSVSTVHYPVNLNVLVTNVGDFPHTFTVAPQSNVTLLPSNFTSYFSQHAPLADASVSPTPGSSVWANFTITGPGVYMYICTVPGHFASGMFGYLYVDVAPPAPAAPPSTAIVDTWILTGSGVLLGIGVVLALVAAYTGRFPRRPRAHEGHP